jgi:hypothetical protein
VRPGAKDAKLSNTSFKTTLSPVGSRARENVQPATLCWLCQVRSASAESEALMLASYRYELSGAQLYSHSGKSYTTLPLISPIPPPTTPRSCTSVRYVLLSRSSTCAVSDNVLAVEPLRCALASDSTNSSSLVSPVLVAAARASSSCRWI